MHLFSVPRLTKPERAAWLPPREHGAWGILLLPYLTAVVIAGRLTLPVFLGLGAVLFAFLARTPLELLFVPQSRGRPPDLAQQAVRHLALIYGLAGIVCGTLLVLMWKLYLLLVLAAMAGLVFGARLWTVARGTDRSWLAELVATTGLTLTALVAWVVSTGEINRTGALVWLLNWVFFSLGMVYVKSRIRAQMAQRRPEVADLSALVLAFHLAVVVFVLVLVFFRWVPLLVVVPFVLAAVRAGWPSRLRGGPPALVGADAGGRNAAYPLSLRRLGWSEVGLSLLFAGFLTLGFRL